MTEEYDSFFMEMKKFKEKQNKQKQRGLNDYNLLTTVLKPHDEVRLHSRVIGSLLNPEGMHYQGSLFLENFLEVIGLKDINFDIEKARVELEYKNIDLYLTDGNKHIIIENKVYAGDQASQIKRYIQKILEENKNMLDKDLIVIYLSINRDYPSDYSLGKEEKMQSSEYFKVDKDSLIYEGNNNILKGCKFVFNSIHYEKEILKWLEKCLHEVQNITNLNEAIKQYIDVVKIVINQQKEKIMPISKKILESRENFEIATEIFNKYNLVKEEICDKVGVLLEKNISLDRVKYEQSLIEDKLDSKPIIYFKIDERYEIRIHSKEFYNFTVLRLLGYNLSNDQQNKIKIIFKNKIDNYKSLSWNLLEYRLSSQLHNAKLYDLYTDTEDDIKKVFNLDEIIDLFNIIILSIDEVVKKD